MRRGATEAVYVCECDKLCGEVLSGLEGVGRYRAGVVWEDAYTLDAKNARLQGTREWAGNVVGGCFSGGQRRDGCKDILACPGMNEE